MPLFRSHRRVAPVTTTTRARKPGLLSRMTARRRAAPMTTTTRSTRHTRRSRHAGTTTITKRPTMGDKIHGMAKTIMGSITMNRRKKREGQAMKAGSRTTVAATRRRRRW